MRRLFFILSGLFFFLASSCSLIFAEDKASPSEALIGSTFKILAKAFVATTDIEKIKKENIAKLNKMDEEKFRARYAEVYQVIKSLPPGLKAEYAISPEMTRQQAIKDIKSFNKQKLYLMIDSVPDTIIARQFRQYLSQQGQAAKGDNLIGQINRVWSRITAKVIPPATK